MRTVHLYLQRERDWNAMDSRLKHICNTLNREDYEVRVYVLGLDFYKTDKTLPHVELDGKKKSIDNFWNETIGERKLDNGDLLQE